MSLADWQRVVWLAAVLLPIAVRAEVYELPLPGNDVVGAVATTQARGDETLLDVARRHGLGYEDIVRANPDVDPWLPGEGTTVLLPTRFVLPPGPRRGVVLNLPEYRLYYFPEVQGDGPPLVMTYPISIGRMDWATPLGTTRIVSKVINPTWHPPDSVRAEHEADGDPLPRSVPPGPKNPLGGFALRLAIPGYLIHGTNRPAGVGMRVTHGCIRMFPEDIEFLFGQLGVDTPVRIINEPVKIGWDGDTLLLEAHRMLDFALPATDEPVATAPTQDAEPATADEVAAAEQRDPLTVLTAQFVAATNSRPGELDWDHAEQELERASGVPVPIGRSIKNAATSAASH